VVAPGLNFGDDLLGGSFVFDPFEFYAAGVVSNSKEFVRTHPVNFER
jgi:hypothetical protein